MQPPSGKYFKLTLNLLNNEKYVLYYVNLKQALEHILILKNISNILKFRHSHWIKLYIDLCTNLDNENKDICPAEFL